MFGLAVTIVVSPCSQPYSPVQIISLFDSFVGSLADTFAGSASICFNHTKILEIGLEVPCFDTMLNILSPDSTFMNNCSIFGDYLRAFVAS